MIKPLTVLFEILTERGLDRLYLLSIFNIIQMFFVLESGCCTNYLFCKRAFNI